MTPIPDIINLWHVAEAIIDDAFGPDDETPGWFAEFASEYERQNDLEPRDLPPFATTVVRHAGVLKTEDELPAFVIFPALEPAPTYDPDTGEARANVPFGVLLAVEADENNASGDTLHAYVAILKQLWESRRTCGGKATGWRRTNVDYRGLEAQAGGRTLYGADLEYVADNVLVGRRSYLPDDAVPRDDPYTGPRPDTPTVAPGGGHLIITPLES